MHREEANYLAAFLSLIITIKIVSTLFGTYNNFKLERLSATIEGSVISLIFNKCLRFSLMNQPTIDLGHSGKTLIISKRLITKFVRDDALMYGQSILYIVQGFALLAKVLISSVLMSTIAGWVCSLTLALFLVSIVFIKFLNNRRRKKQLMYDSCKDWRLALLKNVLENLTFIKAKVLENYYMAELSNLRISELKFLGERKLMISLKRIVTTIGRNLTFVGFALVAYMDTDDISVAIICATICL
jgi:ABC-type multidrug transport system fused ATPase/permease subunit